MLFESHDHVSGDMFPRLYLKLILLMNIFEPKTGRKIRVDKQIF